MAPPPPPPGQRGVFFTPSTTPSPFFPFSSEIDVLPMGLISDSPPPSLPLPPPFFPISPPLCLGLQILASSVSFVENERFPDGGDFPPFFPTRYFLLPLHFASSRPTGKGRRLPFRFLERAPPHQTHPPPPPHPNHQHQPQTLLFFPCSCQNALLSIPTFCFPSPGRIYLFLPKEVVSNLAFGVCCGYASLLRISRFYRALAFYACFPVLRL